MATAEALTTKEWLEAARLWLRDDGDAAWTDEALRVVEVTAAEGREAPGYIGETMPIRVTVVTGGGVTKSMPFFVKAVPERNAGRAQVAITSRSFLKETGLFERVFPRMCATGGVPWGPRCFVTRIPTLIVMEDLADGGFRGWRPRMTLDFPHCVHALAAIARFHADSLALEERESSLAGSPFRLVDHFPELLEENMFTNAFPSLMATYFFTSLEDIKHVVGLIPQYKASKRYWEIIKRIDDIPNLTYRLVKPSERYRNVICNGDLWIANFLFKYANAEKKSGIGAKENAKEDVKEVSEGITKLAMKGMGDAAKKAVDEVAQEAGDAAKKAVDEVAQEAKETLVKEETKGLEKGEMLKVPSDVPVDVRLIDFQTARYSPPALDVMSFLHMTTRRGLREARSRDLLEAYHLALRRELEARGLQAEELVPWADFVASCEEYAAFGRIISASYMVTDLLPGEVLAAQSQSAEQYERFFTKPRTPLVDEPFENDEYYRERVTEIISEFVDFVVLNL